MKQDAAELKIQVLTLLGWVSGGFDESEHRTSRELLSDSVRPEKMEAVLAEMDHRLTQKEEVLESMRNAGKHEAIEALRAGYELAKAHGYLTESELSVIMELGIAAHLDERKIESMGRMHEMDQAFIIIEELLKEEPARTQN